MRLIWILAIRSVFVLPVAFALPPASADQLTSDRGDSTRKEAIERPTGLSPEQERIRRLLSAERDLAQREIANAIEHRDGLTILLYCYLGSVPEVRQEALRYFTECETDYAFTFRSTLTKIAKEKESRLREIETTTECIDAPAVSRELPQKKVDIHLDKLLSPDPELAIEELKRAIHGRATAEIMLCAMIGNHRDARVIAQGHLIKNKIASREELKEWVRNISVEIDSRLREIELADE